MSYRLQQFCAGKQPMGIQDDAQGRLMTEIECVSSANRPETGERREDEIER